MKLVQTMVLAVACSLTSLAQGEPSTIPITRGDVLSLVEQRQRAFPFISFHGTISRSKVDQGILTLTDQSLFETVIDVATRRYTLTLRYGISALARLPGLVNTFSWDGQEFRKWTRIVSEKEPIKISQRQPGDLIITKKPYPAAVEIEHAIGRSIGELSLEEILRSPSLVLAKEYETISGHDCLLVEVSLIKVWLDKQSGTVIKFEWYNDKARTSLCERMLVEKTVSKGPLVFPTKIRLEDFDQNISGRGVINVLDINPDSVACVGADAFEIEPPAGTAVLNTDTHVVSYVAGRSAKGDGVESVEERLDVLVEKALKQQKEAEIAPK